MTLDAPKHVTEHELRLGALIQQSILPRECPVCGHGAVAARHRMSGYVGGDFYDFERVGPDRIGFLMGDVMGHGVSAALIMCMVMGLIRRTAQNLAAPSEVANLVNHRLLEIGEQSGESFLCSMFYGVLNVQTRELEYTNAGHPAPLLCNRRTCRIGGLDSNAPLLGAEENLEAEPDTLRLADEDRLVLYSDGIIDARNAEGERYSVERLHRLASRSAEMGPDEVIDAIFAEVDAFAEDSDDDQSIVVVDFKRVSKTGCSKAPSDVGEGDVMQKYECTLCSYVYDPAQGDPDNDVPPGTAFEDVPEDWVCPECGAEKEFFEPAE